MKTSLLLACLLAMAAPFSAQAQVSPASSLASVDQAAIHAVVDAFGKAIVARDRAALDALVLSDTITFASALDAPTLARIRQKRAGAIRFEIGSWSAFVESITTSTVPLEEQFWNVSIQGNGTIATVYFDYAFLENGVETNRGHEAWAMLNTGDGWRIASVIWSISDPAPQAVVP